MEYYNTIKALLKLEDLTYMRITQLKEEKEIDKMLVENQEQCPAQVIQYMINARAINRWHAEKIHNQSIINYPEHMENAYQDVESMQSKLHSLDCNSLARMNRVVLNVLKQRKMTGNADKPVGYDY